MRFFERMFMGIKYHKRVHIIALVMAILFTISGLFFQTNLMLENLTSNNFTKRLEEFPRDILEQVNSASSVIMTAHHHQQQFYLTGFWITVTAFAVVTIALAVMLLRSRRAETQAYLVAGKSSADIALQGALESLTVFVTGFTITALVSLLSSGFLVNLINEQNRTAFIAAFSRGDSGGLAIIKTSLAVLFQNRVTDFNIHGLLYGRGLVDHMLDGPAGYSISFAFGAVIVVLVNFVVTYVQAFRMRAQL
ncbi:hypothetical protein [Lacticaseibacillus zhaodongensis]|uniref:hypothetical protein n=1 Tax=Lacticaseibacillus zhaodongensis TaxID=2668065 RepID=UPI0012D2CEA5|nr:hypothetical protein [Lacticaseibacillus zhaodongensis]